VPEQPEGCVIRDRDEECRVSHRKPPEGLVNLRRPYDYRQSLN
jgi:hypothetical protein